MNCVVQHQTAFFVRGEMTSSQTRSIALFVTARVSLNEAEETDGHLLRSERRSIQRLLRSDARRRPRVALDQGRGRRQEVNDGDGGV